MDFYKDILGLEEVYRRRPVKAGFPSNGNTHHDIGMVEYSGPAGWKDEAGLNHIAFELETQVDLVDGYNRAEAAGIHFPRTIDHEIAHAWYFSDPDGNRVEIYADTTKNWRTERTGLVQYPTYEWTPGSTPPSPEMTSAACASSSTLTAAPCPTLRTSTRTSPSISLGAPRWSGRRGGPVAARIASEAGGP